MKMFLLTLVVMMSSAFAAEIKVLDIPSHFDSRIKGEFVLNKELGRVWVEVTVEELYRNDEDYSGDTYRAKVEGLSYDAHTKTVNLDIEGQLVECAVTRQRGVLVFRHEYLRATNCTFQSKVVTVLHDDGFEIQKRKRLQVFLVTK